MDIPLGANRAFCSGCIRSIRTKLNYTIRRRCLTFTRRASSDCTIGSANRSDNRSANPNRGTGGDPNMGTGHVA